MQQVLCGKQKIASTRAKGPETSTAQGQSREPVGGGLSSVQSSGPGQGVFDAVPRKRNLSQERP